MPDLVGRRGGHFRLESGLHTESWIDLDQLFLHPRVLQPFVSALAERLARHTIDMVCGPMTGGAFLAELIATDLGVAFAYADRLASGYEVQYSIPPAMRAAVHGQRVALVDDAISAGSAVGGTLSNLNACGAHVVALAALILVGDRPHQLAAKWKLPLEWLEEMPTPLWHPSECPLCAAGEPLLI